MAGLSNSGTEGGARSFRSVNKGSKGLPKAFIALSSEELSVGGTLARTLEIQPAQSTEPERSFEQQTYTFADAFCGAGGMSLGARAAGLRLSWAFD